MVGGTSRILCVLIRMQVKITTNGRDHGVSITQRMVPLVRNVVVHETIPLDSSTGYHTWLLCAATMGVYTSALLVFVARYCHRLGKWRGGY